MTQPIVEDAPAKAPKAVVADAPAAGKAVGDMPDSGEPWVSTPLAWYSVAMIALVAVFSGLDSGVLSLMVNNIKRDMGLTDVQIGLLIGGSYSLSYFVFGLPMARVSDRGRRKLILPAALFVFSAGTFMCGLVQNFWQFLLCRMVVGAGVSVKNPVSVSLIPDLIPHKHLTRAFSLYHYAISTAAGLSLILGGLLLGWLAKVPPIFLPFVGEVHDWQVVFFIITTPAMVASVIMVLTMPEPARRGRKIQNKATVADMAKFLFKSPATVVLVPLLLAAAVSGIEGHGIHSWRPAFYERTYGWKPQDFGPIVGSASFITVPVGLLLGTILVEYLGRKGDYSSHLKVVFISHAIALPLTIVAPLMPNMWLALGCNMLAGTIGMMSSPAQLTAMQIVTPNEFRAQLNAVYMLTVGLLGFGLGPLVVGAMTDYVFSNEADLRYAMVTMAAIGGPIALALYGLAVKPYGRAHRAMVEGTA